MKLKSLLTLALLIGSLNTFANHNERTGVMSVTDTVFYATVLPPFITTAGITDYLSGDYKELAGVVKGDAVDFLVGLEASDALVNTINILRSNVEGLAQMSDEEIANEIAQIIE